MRVNLFFILAFTFFSKTYLSNETPKNEEHSSETTGGGHGKIGEMLVVYFVIMCITIGAVAREIKKKTGIPYTPMLLVFGILLGTYDEYLGDFGVSIDLVLKINPHGILYIFIPALIFESAFNIDPFLFKRLVWQIIILAIPGVVLGAGLISFFFRVLLGYSSEFSWSGCMTFSSIVCATDPVAVVALLKELGTPLRFNLLLEGESLLNDGTAMVFYMVFSSLYKGQAGTFLDSILQFLRLSLGGALTGVIVWLIMTNWIRRIVKDDVLTTNLTFLACYITFFISEAYLEVSGIIAIVVLGVLFSISGKSKIHPESEHSNHSVWAYMQYLLETVLFIITGCFIGRDLLSSNLTSITTSDVIRMVFFFFLMTLARYLMLVILRPLLNKSGYPIDNKMIVVLTYGGLRGAIALSLGLMVAIDHEFPERFRDIVIFYLTSMIVITVVFNGITIKFIMEKINFVPIHPATQKMHNLLEKRMIIRRYEQKIWLERHRLLAQTDWKEVFDITETYKDIENIKKKHKKGKLDYLEMKTFEKDKQFLSVPIMNREDMISLQQNSNAIDPEELVGARLRCYQMIKKEIQNSHHKGFSSDEIVDTLKDVIDICMEDPTKDIWLLDCLTQGAVSLKTLAFWMKYKNTFLIGFFAKKLFVDEMLYLYDLLYCIINALKNVKAHKSKLLLNHNSVRKIFMELELELEKLENHMFNICDMFPGIVKSLQTKQAAKVILNDQINFLEECFEEGVITDTEYERLRRKIDCQLKYMSLKDFKHQIKGFSDLQFVSPIFRHVEDWTANEDLKQLLTTGEKQKFKKNDIIISADKPVFGVYILTKGRVEETIVNQDKEYQNNLGFGQVISFANILGENYRSRSTIKASSDNTELVFLEVGRLKNLMSRNPKFEEEVFKEALCNLLRTEKTFSDIVFDEDVILNILSEAKVKKFQQGINHSFSQIAYLMKGQIQNCEQKYNYLAPNLITTGQIFQFKSPSSSVIVIPQQMNVYLNENFRFSEDKAVHALGKLSLGRISGLMQNSFVRNVNQAKKDGEFVNKVFTEAERKINELKEVKIKDE